MRQYEVDFERFIISLSRLTGIRKEFINSYVEIKSMNSLFFDSSPPSQLTQAQIRKLELIKEFIVLYELETNRQAGIKLNSSSKSGYYFVDYFRKKEYRQHLCAAYLNNSNTLINVKRFETKDLNDLVKNKKKFIQDILDHNATNVILGRYGSSVNYRLSEEDNAAITQLITISKCISVKILDFINVNHENNYYSYTENGYWPDIIPTVNSISESSLGEITDFIKGDIDISAAGPDREKLNGALSKLTGIKADKLSQYFKENKVKNIFEVTQRNLTLKQKERLADLKVTKNYLPNILSHEIRRDYILDSPKRISEYFRNYFSNIVDKEYFLVAFLDKHERIIKTQVCSEGTINECPIYCREVVKKTLGIKAASIILAHNHPGGSIMPSRADKDVTLKITEAMKEIDVNVKDHIIVAGENAISIREACPDIFNDSYRQQNAKEIISVSERIETARQKSIGYSKGIRNQRQNQSHNNKSIRSR